MIEAMEIEAALGRYLDELVARLRAVVDLDAAYLIGSAALGAYEPGRSDVDVVALVGGPLSDCEKQAVVDAAEALECPARKLELVVYARGSERYELNLNTGELVSFDPANDPSFWFVLDRAAAEDHALVLAGPPWEQVFAPVPRGVVLDAIAEALEWQEANEPVGLSSVLNACRSWAWMETGEWLSKPDAAAWLRDHVRGRLSEER